jgi:molybdopterin-guanine dinucleotide biosynthesis protein A
MSNAPALDSAGRLANVSAALIIPAVESPNDRTSLEEKSSGLLDRLFEDVVVVSGRADLSFDVAGRVLEPESGDRTLLSDLALALAAAREEHVLVLGANLTWVTADLMLALTAFPEHECVAPRIDDTVQSLCCLYRREPALRATRKLIEGGESDSTALLAQLECGILEGKDLAALNPETPSS